MATVKELIEKLVEAGVAVPEKAKKRDLEKLLAEYDAAHAEDPKPEGDGLEVPDDADIEVSEEDAELAELHERQAEVEARKLGKEKEDKVDIVGIRDRDSKFGYIRTYSLRANGPKYLEMAESYVNANPDKGAAVVPHEPERVKEWGVGS